MKLAECDEAMAAEIEVAEACRQLLRNGDEAMTAHLQHHLHVMHRVVEEEQTRAKGNKLRRRMNKWGSKDAEQRHQLALEQTSQDVVRYET